MNITSIKEKFWVHPIPRGGKDLIARFQYNICNHKKDHSNNARSDLS